MSAARITEMYAFIVDDVDAKGQPQEGLIGAQIEPGVWMPFVAADRARVEALRPHAIAIGRQVNREVRLIRFHQHEILETIPVTPVPKGQG